MSVVEHRWTEEQYLHLVEAGTIRGTHLIDGRIYQRLTPSYQHVQIVDRIEALLIERFGVEFVRRKNPIRANGFPEPDLVVLNTPRSAMVDYPGPADVRCIVEVAVTSLTFDLYEKVPAYLAAGIANVFVVTADETHQWGDDDEVRALIDSLAVD